MWMGGPVPLGYDVNDRRLSANRIEANTVNRIFRLYVELGTVRRLKDELDRLGIVTKRRVHKTGKQTGGKPFSRGNLYQLLSNPIYIGRIPHKGETYPWRARRHSRAGYVGGSPEPLGPKRRWANPQDQRQRFVSPDREGLRTKTATLSYLSQAHAHGRRYGYYISRHLMHGAHRNAEGWRIPARTLEQVVTASLSDLCREPVPIDGPHEPGGTWHCRIDQVEGPGGRSERSAVEWAHWKNDAASCMPLSNASTSHRLQSS